MARPQRPKATCESAIMCNGLGNRPPAIPIPAPSMSQSIGMSGDVMRSNRECKVREHRNSDPLSKDSCAGKANEPRILSAAPALDAGVARQSVPLPPKILLLSMPHGAAHQRAAKALREAFAALRPNARVEVIDTLQHCTAWFRAYYNSYLIPLTIWPGLWRWIEKRQHQSESTNPGWIYRRGAQPLFRYLREFAPDVVIATEVGTCEFATLYKRESHANFLLVG